MSARAHLIAALAAVAALSAGVPARAQCEEDMRPPEPEKPVTSMFDQGAPVLLAQSGSGRGGKRDPLDISAKGSGDPLDISAKGSRDPLDISTRPGRTVRGSNKGL